MVSLVILNCLTILLLFITRGFPFLKRRHDSFQAFRTNISSTYRSSLPPIYVDDESSSRIKSISTESIWSLPEALYIEESSDPRKGKGLFTKLPIENGTVIGEYKGTFLSYREYCRKYPSDEDKKQAEYVFLVNPAAQRRDKVYIDAAEESCSAYTRFINHSHSAPNLEATVVRITRRSVRYSSRETTHPRPSRRYEPAVYRLLKEEYQVLFFTVRAVLAGEELLFDYGEHYKTEWNP